LIYASAQGSIVGYDVNNLCWDLENLWMDSHIVMFNLINFQHLYVFEESVTKKVTNYSEWMKEHKILWWINSFLFNIQQQFMVASTF
jgi:hypothetical protein